MYKVLRDKRHKKIRKKISGTKDRPRLTVFRSSQHIYAQIIDDSHHKTLIGISDYKESGTKLEKAYKIGKQLADEVVKAKIKTIVFDRGGYLYQGRIAQLAKGVREGGLKF